jgi:hypothetical protein
VAKVNRDTRGGKRPDVGAVAGKFVRISGGEKRIIVDYFASPRRLLAVQVLGRRGTVTSYMEQWGFRWRDLHDAHPRLLRVMLYDPAVQDVDSTATAIGESVCDYFGPYHETNRLHEVIDLAARR